MFEKRYYPLPPEVRKFIFPAILCLLTAFLSIRLSAQSDLSLWGYVTDEKTGLPITGAEIKLYPGGEHSHTDQNGRFAFYYLKFDEITLVVQSEDYFDKRIEGLKLESDRVNQQDITLAEKIYFDPDQVVRADLETSSGQCKVITIDSPEFENAGSLSDVLEYSPGVILASSGGNNQAATISIGGAPAKQTGIYLDGIPLNSNLTGDFDINSIPIQSVEKIEIYTSGAGGELGVGPLSGAVNIVTRKAALKGEISMHQYVGSFHSGLTDISVQSDFHDKLSGLFIFSQNTSSNDFIYDDPKLGVVKRENNCRDINNRFVNFLYRFSKQDDISLTFSEFSSRAGLPGAVYTLTYTAHKNELFRRWSLISDLSISRKLRFKGSIQQLLSHQHFKDYDSFIPYDSKYRDSRLDIYLNPNLILSRDHHLSMRLQVDFDRFRQDNLLKANSPAINVDEDRVQSGISYNGKVGLMETPLFFDDLSLNLAFTHTASRYFKPLISPAARIDFEKGDRQRMGIHLSYANSYRAPTYGSLFWSEDAFSVGNPNLRPEKSEEFGCGGHFLFRWGGRWDLGVEYKHSFIKDLIYWERRFDGKYVPNNISAAKIKTVMWNLDWEIALNLGKISLAYSLSDPRDRSWKINLHNRYLTFYPRKMLDLGCDFMPGIFFLSVHTRWVSERYTLRANTISLPEYAVTDLRGGVNIKIGRFQVKFRGDIDNLFSEDYQIIERYPLPRRSYGLHLGLTYNYNTGGKDEL